jgi:nucleotide-binding universal stress UspA family protein
MQPYRKGEKMLIPKVEIKKILYPTDLSQSAQYAFTYAVSLADHYQASITLLHVLYEAPEFVSSIIGTDKLAEIKRQQYEEAREALNGRRREHVIVKEILDNFCKEVKADQNLHTVVTDDILVRKGNPVEEILRTVKDGNFDVIVMGTHGHGSFAEAMIGSTARRVVRRSPIPVFTVRLPKED